MLWLGVAFKLAIIVIALAVLPYAVEAVSVYWRYLVGATAVVGFVVYLMQKYP
jgi:hypothetical protein